jgi:hypothetical protein
VQFRFHLVVATLDVGVRVDVWLPVCVSFGLCVVVEISIAIFVVVCVAVYLAILVVVLVVISVVVGVVVCHCLCIFVVIFSVVIIVRFRFFDTVDVTVIVDV